jgi:hypothetical protein
VQVHASMYARVNACARLCLHVNAIGCCMTVILSTVPPFAPTYSPDSTSSQMENAIREHNWLQLKIAAVLTRKILPCSHCTRSQPSMPEARWSSRAAQPSESQTFQTPFDTQLLSRRLRPRVVAFVLFVVVVVAVVVGDGDGGDGVSDGGSGGGWWRW